MYTRLTTSGLRIARGRFIYNKVVGKLDSKQRCKAWNSSLQNLKFFYSWRINWPKFSISSWRKSKTSFSTINSQDSIFSSTSQKFRIPTIPLSRKFMIKLSIWEIYSTVEWKKTKKEFPQTKAKSNKDLLITLIFSMEWTTYILNSFKSCSMKITIKFNTSSNNKKIYLLMILKNIKHKNSILSSPPSKSKKKKGRNTLVKEVTQLFFREFTVLYLN